MKPEIFAVSVVAVLMTGQAQALSCLPPDVARTFTWASKADERFVVLLGRFTHDADPLVPGSGSEKTTLEVAGTFNGQYLGADGFTNAPTLDVQLNMNCLGPWCGTLGNDEELLAFIKVTEAGYILDLDLCYSTTFAPSPENAARAEACMNGQACDEIQY